MTMIGTSTPIWNIRSIDELVIAGSYIIALPGRIIFWRIIDWKARMLQLVPDL